MNIFLCIIEGVSIEFSIYEFRCMCLSLIKLWVVSTLCCITSTDSGCNNSSMPFKRRNISKAKVQVRAWINGYRAVHWSNYVIFLYTICTSIRIFRHSLSTKPNNGPIMRNIFPNPRVFWCVCVCIAFYSPYVQYYVSTSDICKRNRIDEPKYIFSMFYDMVLLITLIVAEVCIQQQYYRLTAV